jgi:prepilin-type N-terminal cleavage/methylation domain-containing protein
MKGGLKTGYSQGFTIVEVMLVLAVSSALFVSAVALVGNKQNDTEFIQSIQQVQSQVQQTADDVVNGFYPSLNNFNCTPNSGGTATIISGTTIQGQNNGCIFLGKVMQFGVIPSPNPNNAQAFLVYSILGSECASGTLPGSSGCDIAQSSKGLSTSLPIAEPTALVSTNGSVNDTTTNVLEYGLNVTSMSYNLTPGSPKVNTGAVGFLQSIASYSNGSLASGSQQVNLYTISGTNINNQSNFLSVLDQKDAVAWQEVSDVNICFTSATTSQSGLVSIGGSGRLLSVTLQIFSDTTCS